MQVTRRDLVKFGGAACLVAGATVGAGAAMADEAGYLVGSSDIAFSEETDILIIGTGVAGLAAGMEPALAGKKIIFAEKKGSFGGDSATSCWFMFATGTKNQLEHGSQTTIEQAWEAAKEKQTATFDFDWWPQWIEGKYFATTKFFDCAAENFGCDFLEPCTMEELPKFGPAVVLPGEGIASGYQHVLSPIQAKLEELGAEFKYNLRAVSLIKDAPDGAVIGCRFHDENGANVDIKANAVVLATGCFIDNGEMMNAYLPEWAHYGVLVNGGSMGEGHTMAWAAGAQQIGMDSSIANHYCNLMGDLPNATTWGYWTPMVLVLPNGKRFIQEGQSHDAAQACLDCGYREWWVIFDQRAFDNRCVGTSVKNNVNIHEDVYRTADTIEDLAVAMDVPVDNLVATFAEYDGYVEAGEDAAFGKTEWLNSLEPPYHALELNVMRYNTSGGVICNADNLVIDNDGNGIPGLYACGAIALPGQASVTACAATGYFTGETLAAL